MSTAHTAARQLGTHRVERSLIYLGANSIPKSLISYEYEAQTDLEPIYNLVVLHARTARDDLGTEAWSKSTAEIGSSVHPTPKETLPFGMVSHIPIMNNLIVLSDRFGDPFLGLYEPDASLA